jgi:arylformamidase
VDAPFHFIEGGETVDRLRLNSLVGPALVVDLSDIAEITAEALMSVKFPIGTTRVLFKTNNSRFGGREKREFNPEYVSLSSNAAEWLVSQGVELVGVDGLSVQKFRDKSSRTHDILLGAGVVIVEGLNLHAIPAGHFDFVCLPIKIVGADGAPARAILIGKGDAWVP